MSCIHNKNYTSLVLLHIPISAIMNSSPPSAAYMHLWIRSTLVQKMAFCLFNAKPLFKPVLGYCRLEPWEQTSVKNLMPLKISSVKWRTFCRGGDELTFNPFTVCNMRYQKAMLHNPLCFSLITICILPIVYFFIYGNKNFWIDGWNQTNIPLNIWKTPCRTISMV